MTSATESGWLCSKSNKRLANFTIYYIWSNFLLKYEIILSYVSVDTKEMAKLEEKAVHEEIEQMQFLLPYQIESAARQIFQNSVADVCLRRRQIHTPVLLISPALQPESSLTLILRN